MDQSCVLFEPQIALPEEVAQKRIGALNTVRVSSALADSEYEVCPLVLRQ